mmetsp:Transcript_20108/g.25467  ORF Transcript_20108/g.25467 Transcript_20108/m.25467 type:complete len:303 (+) Transcript_20108:309-1217(+)
MSIGIGSLGATELPLSSFISSVSVNVDTFVSLSPLWAWISSDLVSRSFCTGTAAVALSCSIPLVSTMSSISSMVSSFSPSDLTCTLFSSFVIWFSSTDWLPSSKTESEDSTESLVPCVHSLSISGSDSGSFCSSPGFEIFVCTTGTSAGVASSVSVVFSPVTSIAVVSSISWDDPTAYFISERSPVSFSVWELSAVKDSSPFSDNTEVSRSGTILMLWARASDTETASGDVDGSAVETRAELSIVGFSGRDDAISELVCAVAVDGVAICGREGASVEVSFGTSVTAGLVGVVCCGSIVTGIA